MRMKKKATSDNFFDNLETLMKETGIKAPEIARKTKLDPKTIYNYINREKQPTVDNADKVGSVFGLTGWQMIMPDLKPDIMKNNQFTKLVQNYTKSDPDSREYIIRVAEKEASYKKTP